MDAGVPVPRDIRSSHVRHVELGKISGSKSLKEGMRQMLLSSPLRRRLTASIRRRTALPHSGPWRLALRTAAFRPLSIWRVRP